MRCSNGHEMPNGAAFCPTCGAKHGAEVVCPAGHPTSADDRFCRTCGVEVARGSQLSDLDEAILADAARRNERKATGVANKWVGDFLEKFPGEMMEGQVGIGQKAQMAPLVAVGAVGAPIARLVQLGYLGAQTRVPHPVQVDGEIDCVGCGGRHPVAWFNDHIYGTANGHLVAEISCRYCRGTHHLEAIKKSARVVCGRGSVAEPKAQTLFTCGVGLRTVVLM